MSWNSLVSPNWFHPHHFEHKWDIMFRNMLDCYFQLTCLATSAYPNQGLAYKCHIQSKFLSFSWVALKKIYIFFWQFELVSEVICTLSGNNIKVESNSHFFKTFTQNKVLITQSDLLLSTHSRYRTSELMVNLSHGMSATSTFLPSLNIWARSYLTQSWNISDKRIHHVLWGAKWAFIIFDSSFHYIRGEE